MAESPVAIIGGGIIGCATAFYLTDLGCRDILLFEQSEIACHSSGKAGGFLSRTWCDDVDLESLARMSFSLHQDISHTYPDLDYQNMCTYKAVTRTNAPKRKFKKNCPNWIMGNVSEVKMIESSENTAKVSPKQLCDRLIAVAKARGTKIIYERVIDFKFDRDVVKAVITNNNQSTYDVSKVVIAAGPWSIGFMQWHFPKYRLPPLRPQTRAHSIEITPYLTGKQVIKECVFQYHDEGSGKNDPEIYPLPDGNVYICGEVDHTPLPDHPNDIIPDIRKCDELFRQAGFLGDAIKKGAVLKKQACYLPGSPDQVPLIGFVPGYPNVLVGTGHTFWGIFNWTWYGKDFSRAYCKGQIERYQPFLL